MGTPTISDLLERNSQWAANDFHPLPLFSEFRGLGIQPPTTLIVTCADPRICPERFFGLQPGETIIFRTVGGRVRPILQDILTLDAYFGTGRLDQLLVVHHTDCGASHICEDLIKADLMSRHPERKSDIEHWEIGAFGDASIAESVKQDVAFVREQSMLSDALKQGVSGYVFDIKTGKVSPV